MNVRADQPGRVRPGKLGGDEAVLFRHRHRSARGFAYSDLAVERFRQNRQAVTNSALGTFSGDGTLK